ncbi:MAG: peptide-methionine (R)-S-oxide reductase MsrB [Candidatus Binatia bacterium]
MSYKVTKTDEEWQTQLTPAQYAVCRRKATERPFSGEYYYNNDPGTYKCVACGAELFESNTKFDAGCGWPSFWQPIEANNIKEEMDFSHGMERVEVLCNNCGSHLGHVFEDGPEPTGLRYCINSVALNLEKK